MVEMGNNLNMKYIVFLTTNKINNKIFIGVHETENPDIFDGYIGCGANINNPNSYNKGKTHLHNAILKYGTSAFHRKTLRVYDTLDEALDLESLLVTDEFVKRTDTYNMIVNKRPVQDIKPLNIKGSILQYNKDGVLLNTFSSASQAAIRLDITRDAVVNAIFDRTTCCGYYFLRAEEDINKLINEKSAKLLINTTPVYRYLKSGEFDKEYSSIREAIKDTPKTSQGSIIRAIKSNRVFAGYKWSYDKSDTFIPFNRIELKAVKVAQYDLDHNLIKIWDSVTECKKEFPCCQKVCKKERQSTKGYIFEYIS